jgi:biopolymer transport protein ExbD
MPRLPPRPAPRDKHCHPQNETADQSQPSDCPRSMPRRSQHVSSNVLGPNLTALLDVVLQLITFFMMLVHFGTKLEGATKAVRVPLAPAALPGTDLTFDRLSVAMNAKGQLLVKGQSLDDDAASAFWAAEARARRAGLEALGEGATALDQLPTVVILRADRAASYGAVRRALAAAQERGFAHFSLVVLRSPPR